MYQTTYNITKINFFFFYIYTQLWSTLPNLNYFPIYYFSLGHPSILSSSHFSLPSFSKNYPRSTVVVAAGPTGIRLPLIWNLIASIFPLSIPTPLPYHVPLPSLSTLSLRKLHRRVVVASPPCLPQCITLHKSTW